MISILANYYIASEYAMVSCALAGDALPEDLARTMLEHAGYKVSLGDDFDEDVDI